LNLAAAAAATCNLFKGDDAICAFAAVAVIGQTVVPGFVSSIEQSTFSTIYRAVTGLQQSSCVACSSVTLSPK
jgi:hypothetical protein